MEPLLSDIMHPCLVLREGRVTKERGIETAKIKTPEEAEWFQRCGRDPM